MNVLVFDVGGTWVRSAVYSDETGKFCLGNIVKREAKWRVNKLENPDELYHLLILYINDAINDATVNHINIDAIGVSLGACMNHITCEVYGAAPILGDKKLSFPLVSLLKSHLPYPVFVINDLTALCYGYISENVIDQSCVSKISALTISSGIAMRTINVESEKIITDDTFGIQGEVGHLITRKPTFMWETSGLCDCGGIEHYGSYLSGKGLTKVFNEWASMKDCPFKDTVLGLSFDKLGDAILALKENVEDSLAISIIDQLSKQLSLMIDNIFAICPDIEQLFISGGVITSLKELLEPMIYKKLGDKSYIYDADWFKKKLFFTELGDHMTLAGVGYYSSENIKKSELL